MLLGGDECGRTQRGNNNAYCQDNEISWYDWEDVDDDLLAFTRRLIALRREHPVFRRRRWFQGRSIRGSVDLGWCRPDGAEMGDDDWDAGSARSVGLFLNGDAITDRDRRGQRVTDDSFLLLFNAHGDAIDWTLPKQWGQWWELVTETAEPGREGEALESSRDLAGGRPLGRGPAAPRRAGVRAGLPSAHPAADRRGQDCRRDGTSASAGSVPAAGPAPFPAAGAWSAGRPTVVSVVAVAAAGVPVPSSSWNRAR